MYDFRTERCITVLGLKFEWYPLGCLLREESKKKLIAVQFMLLPSCCFIDIIPYHF